VFCQTDPELNNNIVHQLDFDTNPVREHSYAVPTLDCCSRGVAGRVANNGGVFGGVN
jgi:hypothetical protein